jgi:hypothetical protein
MKMLACLLTVCLRVTAWAGESSVLDTGAVGDGITDNTAAFQAALDQAAAAGGGIVKVPTGQYRFEGTLTIPGGVTLQGTFTFAPTDHREAPPHQDGSVLLPTAGRGEPDSPPFITLGESTAGLAGFKVSYPDWRQTDVPPVPYPPTVYAGAVSNVSVQDCNFINSYEAVKFDRTYRFLVRNVHGYPSKRGLYVDYCLDIGRVENVHFWPYGVPYSVDDPYVKWININGVAFEFRRCDWCYVLNTFCFGYGVGYKFAASDRLESTNRTTNGSLIGIGADSCERAVLIEETTQPGLQIVNAELVGRWGSETAVCIEVLPGAENALVNLSNSTFFGPIDRCIWMRSPNGHLLASNCTFDNWDVSSKGSPAIQIDAGKAVINANNFMHSGTHVQVGGEVESAIIMGNQAPRGLRIKSDAGNRMQAGLNEEDPVQWTEEAKRHYRLDVGSQGDEPHMLRWHGAEKALEWPGQEGTKRWSAPGAEVVLPVIPGLDCTVTADVYLPDPAQGEPAGIWLGDRCLAEIPDEPGVHVLTMRVTPESDEMVLSFRAKPWVPAEVNPASTDIRQIGFALRSVTVRADGAGGEVFDANNGGTVKD